MADEPLSEDMAPQRLSQQLGTAGSQCVAAGLRTPLPGAPITSPFGWRMHPILKVRRFHAGVDYGAPLGTPVHAAADGVIEQMGRIRHFGWFLRIRHDGVMETVYNHLSGFTPGLAAGKSVSAGEIIGTVGHSGWATGPHLDFEVVLAGQNVAPCPQDARRPVVLLAAEQLQPKLLATAAPALMSASISQAQTEPLMHSGSP